MLVVDDDDFIRQLHSAIGRQLGYEVRTAADGLEAIQQFLQWTPAVVLMDVEMPHLDGLAAARELSKLQLEGVRSVVIAVTGMSLELVSQALGIAACLAKPLRITTLASTIHALESSSDGIPPRRVLDDSDSTDTVD